MAQLSDDMRMSGCDPVMVAQVATLETRVALLESRIRQIGLLLGAGQLAVADAADEQRQSLPVLDGHGGVQGDS